MTQLDTRPQERHGLAPGRRGQALVLLIACITQTMVSLDMAIVNVALPSIQAELGFAAGSVQWVVVAYGLLLGGFLILGGRLTDRFGRRRMYLAGVTVFTAASALAGAAGTPLILVAARGLQGLGAALVVPAALSLLAVTFPEGRARIRAFAIFGGVGGAAGSVGVVFSGLLTAGPGWRWAFLLNLPAGVLLIGLTLVVLTADRPVDAGVRLDVPGAVTLTAGLLLLMYGLHHGTSVDWWAAPTVGSVAAALALLAAFVRTEMRSAAPLVPPATFRNRALVAGNATALLATAGFSSFILIGSLLMQQQFGFSPTETGLAWLATTATILPASLIGARLASRMSVRWPMLAGLAVFAVGAIWLAMVPADSGFVDGLLVPFLCAGIGFGLCEPAIQVGALSGVPDVDTGLASGLIETTREVGGAAGVAVVSTALVTTAGLAGFHLAFGVIAGLMVLGMLTAAVGFVRARPTR